MKTSAKKLKAAKAQTIVRVYKVSECKTRVWETIERIELYSDEKMNIYHRIEKENVFVHRQFIAGEKVYLPDSGEFVEYGEYVIIIPSERKRVHMLPGGSVILYPEEKKVKALQNRDKILVEVDKDAAIVYLKNGEKFVKHCNGETYRYIPLPEEVRRVLL